MNARDDGGCTPLHLAVLRNDADAVEALLEHGATRCMHAPDTGWTGYANLTSRQFSPGPNVDFWNMGLQVLGVASLAAAVNFFVTIVNLPAD